MDILRTSFQRPQRVEARFRGGNAVQFAVFSAFARLRPCCIVVNRDSFGDLGFGETLQRRRASHSSPKASISRSTFSLAAKLPPLVVGLLSVGFLSGAHGRMWAD